MKYKDFEDFMMWEFSRLNPLDDNSYDSSSDWLQDISVDEWLAYGQKYAITKEIK